MCRLFGYVSDRPTSVVELMGRDAFDAFTSLTAVHGDGWGMAWRGAGQKETRTTTSARSAAIDPRYSDLADRPLGAAGIVHLRWATGGLPVAERNSHPFVDGAYAMAHNGNIAPLHRLESLLSADARSRLVGDTDSERYFRFVMQCITQQDDEEAGVGRALEVLHRTFPECSLNALLLTPTRLFAVHINSAAASPTHALHEIFTDDPSQLPAGHEFSYFEMSYRVESHAVCVISSGLTEEGWTVMSPDSIAVIDLATRTATRLWSVTGAG
ncbi:MAG: class II glutamine amidotransferase [Aeromicrobium sp.]